MAPSRTKPVRGGRAWRASWMAILPAALLLPGFLYAALIVHDANERDRRSFESTVSARAVASAEGVGRTISSLISTVNILLSGPAFGPGTRKAFLAQAASGLAGTGIVLFVRDQSTGLLGVSTSEAHGSEFLSETGKLAATAALETLKPQYSVFGSRDGQRAADGFDLWIASQSGQSEPLLVQAHVPSAYLANLLNPSPQEGNKVMVALYDGGGSAIAEFGESIDNLFKASISVPGPGWQLSVAAPAQASDALAARNWVALLVVSLVLTGLTVAASQAVANSLWREVDNLNFNIGALAIGEEFKPIAKGFPPIQALMQTISDQKSVLDERRDSGANSDRLRLALAAAGMGVWQWDRCSGKFSGDENFTKLVSAKSSDDTITPRLLMAKLRSSDRRRLLSNVRSVTERAHPLVDDIRVERDDGEMRWLSINGVPLTDSFGRVQGLVGTCQDVTDAKRSAKRTEQLLREVTHRSKNMLALVLAMARLTAREAPDIDSHLRDFSLRVAGLSASQDLIVAADWQNVDLGALAVAQITATARSKADRVTISGPSFLLTPEAAQTVGMILTELTLNALAHGALADARGHIKLGWELTGDDEIKLTWRETGVHGFEPGKPTGYGMAAVERFSIQGLKVSASFSPQDVGFTWSLIGPISNLGVRPRAHRT